MKKFIKDLKVKEHIDTFFVLSNKNMRKTKQDKPYLELTLLDKTGKIEARVWDDADRLNLRAESGDVVRVKGIVEEFREEKQVKVEDFQKAEEKDFSYEDMVRVAEDRDRILEKTTSYLKKIKNPWIHSLADTFLKDKELMAAFYDGIGGKSWHNAYVGGLLEHTYEVMYIVDRMSELYPDSDRDTMIFGAFIHDVGKVYELDAKRLEYTIEGGLVGHIVIGYRILMEKISSVAGFPGDLSLRLAHMILSHHGEYEQQSPVLPKTLEATIVYHADELVSQANAIKELSANQSAAGKVWSDFVQIKSRKYFIKDKKSEDWALGAKGAIDVGDDDR